MKSDENPKEREGEREGQKRGEGATEDERAKDGEQERVKQRARGEFSCCLCQWPLCGGVCCLFVV